MLIRTWFVVVSVLLMKGVRAIPTNNPKNKAGTAGINCSVEIPN